MSAISCRTSARPSRPASARAALVILALLLTVTACGELTTSKTEAEVGSQRLKLRIPAGWEQLDHGNQCVFRREGNELTIEDLGRARRTVALEDRFEDLLKLLGHDSRRDIESVEKAMIHDRDVVQVDTWDRLSHDYRQRYAFMENDGRVFVIWTSRGRLKDSEAAFKIVLDSLEFVEGDGTDG